MERFIDHCCPQCIHSKETPCGRFIDCCMSGPLCHDNADCTQKRVAIIKRLAHSPGYQNN